MEELLFDFYEEGDVLTIKISGEIDAYNSAHMKKLLSERIETTDKKAIIIDMSGVSYIDSAGIGALISLLKKSLTLGKEFMVSNLQPMIEKVFKITRLDKSIRIIPSKKVDFKKGEESMADFVVDIKEEGKALVITVKGDIDAYHSASFKQRVREKIKETSKDVIAIDMSEVPYVDSAGLGSIVSLVKESKQNNKDLVLVALQPQVRKIFEMTKLDKVVRIVDTLEEV